MFVVLGLVFSQGGSETSEESSEVVSEESEAAAPSEEDATSDEATAEDDEMTSEDDDMESSETAASEEDSDMTGGMEGDEAVVSLEDAPANIYQVAMAIAAAHDMEITDLDLEVESDGTLNYEFGGEGFEIDVTAEGRLDEVELAITMEDLPEEVATTLETFLQDFEPSTIEVSKRPTSQALQTHMVYEFEGELGGAEVDIEISADGQSMAINFD